MSKLKLKIKKGTLYILLIAILLSTTISSFPLTFTDRSTRLPKSSSIQYETPDQWSDFSFTKGSEGAIGELETNNDANYARVDAGSTTGYTFDTYLGYIKPNADIYTYWREGDAAPHWSKIDEARGDMNGDGRNIRTSSSYGSLDSWDFTTLTLPSGWDITKLIVYMFLKEQTTEEGCKVLMGSNLFGITGFFDAASTNYVWKSLTFSGLSLTQADLNSFQMNVINFQSPFTSYWQDIETVYVEIYGSPLITVYSFDYEITMTLTDLDLLPINYLKYDYRTTVSVDCDLDIYNWDTQGWTQLESNSDTGWIIDYYALTDPYISATNQVTIRFQTKAWLSNFDMELDQLCIQCSSPDDWIPKTLIGSSNRYFPNIEESKLGFTIYTIDVLVEGEPVIEFSIKENINDPEDRYIRLYVDGIKIFETYTNIPTGDYYAHVLPSPQIMTSGTHSIVIEINSGYYGDAPHYILEYLKVGGVVFVESYLYNDGIHIDRFTPMQIYSFDQSSDEAVVTVTSCLYIDNEDLKIGGSYHPSLSTEIIFLINPDRDYYYEIYDPVLQLIYGIEEYWYFINSMKIQWKIIDNGGNFLSYNDLNGAGDDPPQIHPNYNGDYVYYEMEYLITAFNTLVSLLLPDKYLYISIPLSILLATLDSTPNPPETSICQAESFPPTIEGSWTTGTRSCNPAVDGPGVFGTVPNPECDETSMKICYYPYLTLGNYGYFQVQMSWILDLDRHWKYSSASGIDHYITDGIELSGMYYYNFEYVDIT